MNARFTRSSRLLVAGVLALGLAACDGNGNGSDDDTTPDAGASDVSVVGTDALAFEPTELTVSAGPVAIQLTSEDAVEHNVVIEELDDQLVVEAAAGESAVGTVDLEAGTYTFYCNIPGHRAAGMEGTITVN